MLLQLGKLYILQILHHISGSSRPEVFCKKTALKLTKNLQENTFV